MSLVNVKLIGPISRIYSSFNAISWKRQTTRPESLIFLSLIFARQVCTSQLIEEMECEWPTTPLLAASFDFPCVVILEVEYADTFLKGVNYQICS